MDQEAQVSASDALAAELGDALCHGLDGCEFPLQSCGPMMAGVGLFVAAALGPLLVEGLRPPGERPHTREEILDRWLEAVREDTLTCYREAGGAE